MTARWNMEPSRSAPVKRAQPKPVPQIPVIYMRLDDLQQLHRHLHAADELLEKLLAMAAAPVEETADN
jgi:hypothetical protein